MRVRMKDERVFEGTPRQIVTNMRAISLGQASTSLRDYVAFVKSQTQRWEGVDLEVTGETDDEIAASLLAALERAGLMSRLS